MTLEVNLIVSLDEKAQTMFGTEGVVNLKTSY